MKRDMELIRELLLKLEQLDVDPVGYVGIPRNSDEIAVAGYAADQFEHHMEMLYDAGFIDPGTRDGARGESRRLVDLATRRDCQGVFQKLGVPLG